MEENNGRERGTQEATIILLFSFAARAQFFFNPRALEHINIKLIVFLVTELVPILDAILLRY